MTPTPNSMNCQKQGNQPSKNYDRFALSDPPQISGQISIIPKPELRGFWGDFPYFSPPFKVTNRRGTGRYNLPRSLDQKNIP